MCTVEVYSRVTGFCRPTSTWNKGKLAEWQDRKRYDLSTMNNKTDTNTPVKSKGA